MPRTARKRTSRPQNRGRKLNKRQLRQVKRVIAVRQELKYLNVTQGGYPASTTSTIQQVSGISQGTTDSQRDGDRCMLKKIYLRWNCVGGDEYNHIRFIVFQWKAENLIAPIAGDILLVGSSGNIDFTSQYNHDKRSIYKILYDKVLLTVGNGTQSTLTNYPYMANYIHYNRKTIIPAVKQLQYEAASATLGINQIYVLSLSDSSIPLNHPQISYTMKILFTDS